MLILMCVGRTIKPKLKLLTQSLLIGCILILGACANKSQNDYDINYNFTALKSFNQLLVNNIDDPLTSERINNDIKQSLITQGYVFTVNNPDFLVNYMFVTEDKPKDSGLSIGLGTGSWGTGGGISLGTSVGIPLGSDTAKIQTIQIDIIEPETKRLIWRGTGQYHFDLGGEDKADSINTTVHKILAQFPPKK